MPLDAIEAAAVRAVREDPWRSWEFIQFGPTPLPSTTVRQKRALNPRRGPLDSAEVESIMKVAYTTASWRACKPERVKNDGRVLPAERPSVFETEEEAHATLDRYHRLGTRVGVPLSGHLSYGVVCPLSEWEATAGQPTADRETQQLQAEAEMERIKVAKRSLQEQYDDLMAKVRAPHLLSRDESLPPHGSEEWKDAIVAAVQSGEGSTSVARRFQTNDRQVRRYLKRAHRREEADPVVGQTIDPALLGEDS